MTTTPTTNESEPQNLDELSVMISAPMFADRETLTEAYDYFFEVLGSINAADRAAALTAAMVLANTIAQKINALTGAVGEPKEPKAPKHFRYWLTLTNAKKTVHLFTGEGERDYEFALEASPPDGSLKKYYSCGDEARQYAEEYLDSI